MKLNNGQLGALQDDSLHSRDDADADVDDNDGHHIIIVTNIAIIIIIIITSLPAS